MKSERSFILRLFNVRKEETGTVGYFFLHHFFLGLGLALLLTVAGTLFLASFTVDYFPMVYLLSALMMMLSGRVYSYFEHKVPFKKLLPQILLFLVVLSILFRVSFLIPSFYYLPIVLFIGFRVLYLISNLEFWGLSSLVFDVRQGKRLFGLISSGDVPAKLLGYLSVNALVPLIGLQNLLIIAAIAFACSYFFLLRIFDYSDVTNIHEKEHHHSQHHFSDKTVLKTYFGNSYIFTLSGLGFLIMAAFTIVDYTFLSNVQSQYHTQEQLASFLSIFFTVGYTLTLVTKLLFSGRVSDKLGIKYSLLILPVILIGFSLFYIFNGSADNHLFQNMAFIGILSMTMGVVKLSITDPIYLAMFQPLQTQLRLKGHTVIKGFMQPLALGVIGFILWALIKLKGAVYFYDLNFALLITSVLWIASVFPANRKYIETLGEAIRKRFITGAEIAITDEGYFDLLVEKIKSDRPTEVINAMSMLEKSNLPVLKAEVPDLLLRNEALILHHTISLIEKYKWANFTDSLFHIYTAHPSEHIQSFAVKIYCKLFEDAGEIVMLDFETKSKEIQEAIISGLIMGEDVSGRMEAERQLMQLISSTSPSENITACDIIGTIADYKYYKPILNFLAVENKDVLKAAIQTSATIKNVKLVPALFKLLINNTSNKDVISCLGNFGEPAAEAIRNFMKETPDINEDKLLDFIHVLEESGGDIAKNILVELISHSTADIRSNVLSALRSMSFTSTSNDKAVFQERLNEEFKMCYRILKGLGDKTYADVLTATLNFELDKCKKSIFDLLALLYDKEMVKKAEATFHVASKEKKANALEILDHIIPKKVHECLAALVDNISLAEKLEKLKSFSEPEKHPILFYIVNTGNGSFSNWTIATALRNISLSDAMFTYAVQYYGGSNLLLRQSASEALHKFKELDPVHYDALAHHFNFNLLPVMHESSHQRLSEIEKVLILKSTDLFSGTPENIIAEIVPIVREEFFTKDEIIFKKGDSGSSMYIIYEGGVKIHDGEKVFAELGRHDFFGELALLDPEPRSASATSNSDTLLLKLDEEEAYELMEERIEVLKSIIRILCRRIRGQNQKLAAVITPPATSK